MKIMITGASGQLGRSLIRTVPSGYEVYPLTHADLDICDSKAVLRTVENYSPQVIVNAAAYTAVDKAETEANLAFAVNADGPENLARAAKRYHVRLVHISTDFVFNGLKSSPYIPQDAVGPLCTYGRSKVDGEIRIRTLLGESSTIIRTSWVYAIEGNNFVKTMLRLFKEKEVIAVISDQIGTPTWAMSLAEFVWRMIQKPKINGIYHWSDAGVASWYDFAVAIQEEALAIGLISRAIPIQPIDTSQYPLPAIRPAYSVLSKVSATRELEMIPTHWRVNLRHMLREYCNA